MWFSHLEVPIPKNPPQSDGLLVLSLVSFIHVLWSPITVNRRCSRTRVSFSCHPQQGAEHVDMRDIWNIWQKTEPKEWEGSLAIWVWSWVPTAGSLLFISLALQDGRVWVGTTGASGWARPQAVGSSKKRTQTRRGEVGRGGDLRTGAGLWDRVAWLNK